MSPLNQAYLLKGWLLDKNPPTEVIEALEAVIAELGRVPQPVVTIAGPAISSLRLPPLREPEPRAEGSPESRGDLPDQNAPGADCVDDHGSEPTAPPKKKRKYPELTAEQKAAVAQRLKAGREAKKRASAEDEPTPDFTKEELRIKVPVHRRTSKLTDADWSEIKEMLAAGRTLNQIASDYDEEPEDLDVFIERRRGQEAQSPGEAQASPSKVASDAARQT
jgi:hypothetical protein